MHPSVFVSLILSRVVVAVSKAVLRRGWWLMQLTACGPGLVCLMLQEAWSNLRYGLGISYGSTNGSFESGQQWNLENAVYKAQGLGVERANDKVLYGWSIWTWTSCCALVTRERSGYPTPGLDNRWKADYIQVLYSVKEKQQNSKALFVFLADPVFQIIWPWFRSSFSWRQDIRPETSDRAGEVRSEAGTFYFIYFLR